MLGEELKKALERLDECRAGCDAGDPFYADVRAYDTIRDFLRSAAFEEMVRDAGRLDYIERTFSGMTNRERYLPVQMIWGSGCNGRTLREACDKYMKRDTAMSAEGAK